MRKTLLAALTATIALGAPAFAQNYPSHPITAVVPFSAGGPTDAMMRILGYGDAWELLGKNPAMTSPPTQPGGESSAVLAQRHMQECMTKGSARFDWVSLTPQGKEVPMEVALTRIEWSGRQVIQAFITDITERKQAELALREANRELRREIEQRTRAEASLNERVRTSTLSTEVALALNAGDELPAMLQQCAELVVRHLDKVGVLANVLVTVREAGINAQQIENTVFQEAAAACCVIELDERPAPEVLERNRSRKDEIIFADVFDV